MSANFFCGRCVKFVCRDCQSIGIEAVELSARRGFALMESDRKLREAVEAKERAERRAAEWERIMKLGQHALLLAWMESQTSTQLRERIEMVVERKGVA